MKPGSRVALAHRIYDKVHLFLWAMLAAFAVYFLVFVAPKIPEIRVQAELKQRQEIAEENQAYCAKWQMGPRTAMHNHCLDDLQTLRASIQTQLEADTSF